MAVPLMAEVHPPRVIRQLEFRVFGIMIAIMAFQTWGLAELLWHWPIRAILYLFTFRLQNWDAWFLGLLVAWLYSAASMRSLPYIRSRALDLHWLKFIAIPFAFGAGLVEELIFRRLLIDTLANHGYATVSQIAVSAFAFGAFHSVFGLFSGSWRRIATPVLWTTVLGAALAVVYIVGGHDLAPCVWSHTLIDLAIEPWLLIAVMLPTATKQSPSS